MRPLSDKRGTYKRAHFKSVIVSQNQNSKVNISPYYTPQDLKQNKGDDPLVWGQLCLETPEPLHGIIIGFIIIGIINVK